jgi:hypothetical protein
MKNPPEEYKSAGNYWLLDEESTGIMEFYRELLVPGRGNDRKYGILLGITSSWMRNPPEEWNSAGKYWLMVGDSDQQDQKSSDW